MSRPTAAALLACALLIAGSRPQGCAVAACRLPTATRPVSYELRFVPHMDGGADSTFSGVARITVYARAATDAITLHLKDLDVTSATVTDVRLGDDVPVDRLVYRAADEQLEIRLNASVAVHRTYLVTVWYGGKIRADSTGLYASSYVEGDVTK